METMPLNLFPGEWLLWEGRPVRSTILRPNDPQLIRASLVSAFFGAPLTAFCVFVVVHLGLGAGIFGLGGLYIGSAIVYALVGRFVVRAVISRHVRYVLTNQRLMIISGSGGRRIRSAYLGSLPRPYFTEAPDGSGSITFGPHPPALIRKGRRVSLKSYASEPSTTPALWYVPDVRRLVDLIAQAQHAEPPASHSRSSAYLFNPEMGGATAPTRSDSVKRGRVLQPVVLAVAALGIYVVYLSASGLHRTGFDVTNATVTSCDVVPHSKGTLYNCDVMWTDDGGQHHATLRNVSYTPTIPIAVHGNAVSRGDDVWLGEGGLAAGIGLLVVAVSVPVIRARRRRNSGA
jgi:hypothetical protein